MEPQQPPTEEEIKAERRRERWQAFFTPMIYMGSIVGSVALMMALIKTCTDRFSPTP
jgi:hypothetical protein